MESDSLSLQRASAEDRFRDSLTSFLSFRALVFLPSLLRDFFAAGSNLTREVVACEILDSVASRWLRTSGAGPPVAVTTKDSISRETKEKTSDKRLEEDLDCLGGIAAIS